VSEDDLSQVARPSRASREQLALALGAARMVAWDWDTESGEVVWSGDPEAVRGLGPGGLVGTLEGLLSVVHPEDRPLLETGLARALESDERLSTEFRVVGDDGTVRWVAADARSVHESGRPVRMVGVARDITGPRRADDALGEGEEGFRVLADAAPVFIWMSDTAGARTYFNPQWLRFRGRSMDQELGDGWTEGIHPDDRERALADYLGAIRRREPYETEYRLRRADGEYPWILVRGVPRTGPRGAFRGFVGWCVDITERREAEERWRLLAAIGMVLDRPLSIPERLEALARVLLPGVADACIVTLADEAGVLQRAVVTHVAPQLERRLQALPAPTDESPMTQVTRTREPLLVPDVRERLERRPPGAVADAVRRAWMSARSAVIAPLVARGRLVGVLALATSRAHSDRRMDERDLRLASQIASRAALAIDNARLFETEQDAVRRIRLLSEASGLLGSSLEYERTLPEVAQLVVDRLADRCAVHLVSDAGRIELAALASAGEPAGADGPGRAGEAQAMAEVAGQVIAGADRDPDRPGLRRAVGSAQCVCVPLVARDATLGAMTMLAGPESNRRLADADLALARELADRAALAIDNARLYEAQHTIAHTLQRALMPPSLPAIPGARLGAAYVAMGRGVEAGGDFYDVVPCADGRWIVVVGDVCGKGPEAAALTALARYTLRAIARRDPSPATMLTELNEHIVHQLPGNTRFLTACLGLLEPVDGVLRVRLASAGHPPALVRRSDGSVEQAAATGAFVGVLPQIRLVPSEMILCPGDRLVLYTDGLVEARTRAGGLVGEEGLLEAIAGLGDAPAAELAPALAGLARQGAGGRLRDDVAVLVVEAAPG
jgi:PAS domain S-box-containing protein